MDFYWITTALGDIVWLALAFALGLLSRVIGLPPLVGYLAAGFLLNGTGVVSGDVLQQFADLGITLLLFTVGLKLNLRSLAKPQIWAVTGLHTTLVVAVFGLAVYALALFGTPFFAGLDFPQSILVAFALSFSSTVFVVKVLEEKGEMATPHGRIAIGILIMQDLAAVVFLAVSSGKSPSQWALLLVLLVLLRPLLHRLLQRVGHGELLVLFGFVLALGGAEIFELVGLKGDLGALLLGVLISNHSKAEEMAKTMLGFKDLFLLGFFLSIGLYGELTYETFIVGALIAPFVFVKAGLFFALLAYFRLRARTAFLASANLTNFSEFGLIVAMIGVTNGWLDREWLVVLAVALSLSFAIAATLNAMANDLYARHRPLWQQLQRSGRLPDDQPHDIDNATIAIVGMGGVGTGAYDTMRESFGDHVVGVEIDPITVKNQRGMNRKVLLGDPSDADFWDRVQATHTLDLIMLALPKLSTSLEVIEQLKLTSFKGRIAATARFPDEVVALQKAGASTVFNIYTEAGAGYAAHVAATTSPQPAE